MVSEDKWVNLRCFERERELSSEKHNCFIILLYTTFRVHPEDCIYYIILFFFHFEYFLCFPIVINERKIGNVSFTMLMALLHSLLYQDIRKSNFEHFFFKGRSNKVAPSLVRWKIFRDCKFTIALLANLRFNGTAKTEFRSPSVLRRKVTWNKNSDK